MVRCWRADALWHTARVLLNLSPLRRYREFRLLFIGQTVSLLGSMLTYVAVPYQVYQLTESSWLAGMVSAAQLLPMLALGLLGGAFADRLDRRRLLVWSEVIGLVAPQLVGEKPSRTKRACYGRVPSSISVMAGSAAFRPRTSATKINDDATIMAAHTQPSAPIET